MGSTNHVLEILGFAVALSFIAFGVYFFAQLTEKASMLARRNAEARSGCLAKGYSDFTVAPDGSVWCRGEKMVPLR